MLKDILPDFIFNEIKKYNYEFLQEIHLRVNDKPVLLYNSKNILLDNFSTKVITSSLLENIVLKIANNSIYTVQNQLKKGYLCLNNGVRIGISGNFSEENFNLKNIQGLNIRLPHQIFNCSKLIFDDLFYKNTPLNTLIISPPGAGKTTIIRDILYQFNFIDEIFNITIVDDRNELCAMYNGVSTLKTYCHADIITNISKEQAILFSVKNLNPDIIVTDEITSPSDVLAIEKSINLGIKIIASIHATDLNDIITKKEFSSFIKNKHFDRYIILSKRDGVGNITGFYDKNFKKIPIYLYNPS